MITENLAANALLPAPYVALTVAVPAMVPTEVTMVDAIPLMSAVVEVGLSVREPLPENVTGSYEAGLLFLSRS